jgi:hypothetical protein
MAYRILSLDGGGAWALIEVNALITLYDAATNGHQVLADFDLVAANSGGSLVLGGLVEDLKLGDLLGYFEDEAKRKAIFSPTSSIGDRVLSDLIGIGPKYSAEAKLPALERLLPKTGNTSMTSVVAGVRGPGGAAVHLMIVGFDYDRNRANFFRSAPAGTGGVWGEGAPSTATLAEAIHASTNAPVNYFDAPAEFPGQLQRYWDGGVTGCNNPVLAAVTEAIVLGQKSSDIVALSLGTGTVYLPVAQPGAKASPYETPYGDPGLETDLRKLATAILDDPPDAATFIAHTMTGGGAGVPAPAVSRVVRMNPMLRPVLVNGNGTPPAGMTVAQFKYLCGLDMDAVEPNQVAAIASCAALWLKDAVPNQPIRMDGKTMKTEIGYDLFSAALAAWKAIR